MWRPWLGLLTQRHTLIRYDYRGCGLSDRQGVAFSLEQHIDDLEAVVEAAGLESFALVAQAGGGAVPIRILRPASATGRSPCPLRIQARGRSVRGMPVEAADESEALLKLIEFGWRNEGPAYGQFSRHCICPGRALSDVTPTAICCVSQRRLRTPWRCFRSSLKPTCWRRCRKSAARRSDCTHARIRTYHRRGPAGRVAHLRRAIRAAGKPESHPAGNRGSLATAGRRSR